MRKFALATILLLLLVGIVVAASYSRLYYPMTATLSGGSGMWEIESLPLNFWSSDVMPDGTTIIATVRETRTVYKSLDEGLTWTQIFTPPSEITGASLTFCDSYGNIYVSVSNNAGKVAGLWRSDDGGNTWNRVWQDPVKPEGSVRFRGMCEVNGILYFGESVAGGGACDIYKSTNMGVNWSKISSISGGKHIHGIQYNPYNGWFYAVLGDPGYSANGIWRSKDNCLTWDQFYNLPNDWDIMSIGFYQDYVFSAIHWREGQVMRFRDNDNLGATWAEVFRASVTLQNWVQHYQRGGNDFMLSGGEDAGSTPVALWISNSTPFNSGTWYKLYTDGTNTGYKGIACASHKISQNGWLFIANSHEGHGLRVRFSVP